MAISKAEMDAAAEQVARALDQRGMKQSELADQAGVRRSHLSQFLRKEKGMGTANLQALSSVLGINLSSVEIGEPCTALSLGETWRVLSVLGKLGVERKHLLILADNPEDFQIPAELIVKFATEIKKPAQE